MTAEEAAMFEVTEDRQGFEVVAGATDLASAEVAVATLLTEGYDELHVLSPKGEWLESGTLTADGGVQWQSVDLIRQYDGRAGR